jgi:transcriptional antiterminator RfaH
MEHWYTLHTKPNAEYQVAASLQERGLQTYLPETKSPKARRGWERRPFFPCYVFVKIDFERVGLSRVRWTPGLRRVVAFDDRPAPLPDEVIDLIRRKLDGPNAAAGGWSAHTFRPGETVRIADGPLQGLLATFEGPATPAQRVQVLLKFLGHARRTWVQTSVLEKAPSDAEAPAHKRSRRTRGRARRIKNS